MKSALKILLLVVLFAAKIYGQGTLQVDQQYLLAMGNTTIQGNGPIGESFTPSLSAVGYIQLAIFDGNIGNGLGATIDVNVRSGSITGTILGTSTMTLPDGYLSGVPFNNPPTFYFTSPVAVTSGIPYYFDVSVLSGDTWRVGIGGGGYAGGTGYLQGVANSAVNLTFAEGIVVPEPSTAWLALAGGAIFLCVRRWQKSPRRQM